MGLAISKIKTNKLIKINSKTFLCLDLTNLRINKTVINNQFFNKVNLVRLNKLHLYLLILKILNKVFKNKAYFKIKMINQMKKLDYLVIFWMILFKIINRCFKIISKQVYFKKMTIHHRVFLVLLRIIINRIKNDFIFLKISNHNIYIINQTNIYN